MTIFFGVVDRCCYIARALKHLQCLVRLLLHVVIESALWTSHSAVNQNDMDSFFSSDTRGALCIHMIELIMSVPSAFFVHIETGL